MTSTVEQPAQSGFSLFKPTSWAKGGKKVKQAKLGDENNFYFHPELKRWVERGKEEEAARDAAGPPPPPVVSPGSISASLSKRSLSQRYVLQPNLSVSSSLASLGGSLSHTDLASLIGQGGDKDDSRAPSALGSTAPSPPQSSNALAALGFPPSGPSSASGSTGLLPTTFLPTPPQRAASDMFFVPPAVTCEERIPEEEGATAEGENGAKEASEDCSGVGTSAEPSDPFRNGHDAAFSAFCDETQSAVYAAPGPTAHELPQAPCPPDADGASPLADERSESQSVSLADGLEQRPPESLFSSPASSRHQMLRAREVRRMDSSMNASDGGAAISLHDGMGFAPASRQAEAADALEGGLGGGVVANGREAAAECTDDGDTAAAAVPELSVAYGDLAIDGAIAAPAGNDDAASVVAPADADGGPASQYSQYYYQQYAHLYQYALGMGYSEADAVTYAQYYAVQYAAQYESAQPQGHLGDGGGGGGDAAATAVNGDAEGASAGANGGFCVGELEPGADEAATVGVMQQEQHTWQDVANAAEGPLEVGTDAEGGICANPAWSVAYEQVPQLLHGSSGSANAQAYPSDNKTAPLHADLAAAALAAAMQPHTTALTGVSYATSTASEGPAHRSADVGAAGEIKEAAADTVTAASVPPAAVPQLLLGLGAAGAKRLTQLSSAATTVVASLSATVAATAPVSAALSAAASASAGAFSLGGVGGLSGLSEDDFERIMHPGDPAKLDGPLPWELPEHLRAGRKFLALCANWQLANPATPYAPHLLLTQPPQEQQQAEEAAATETRGTMAAAAVAVQAEGSGEAPSAAAAAAQQEPAAVAAEADGVSSYERACRLAQFGQPAELLAQLCAQEQQEPNAGPNAAASVPLKAQAEPGESAAPSALTSSAPEIEFAEIESSEGAAQPPAVQSATEEEEQGPAPPSTVGAVDTAAPAAAAPPLQLSSLPVVDSPRVHEAEAATPGSARSDDPFAGTEHLPLAPHPQPQPSPLASPEHAACEELASEEPEPEPVVEADSARCAVVEASAPAEALADVAYTPANVVPMCAEEEGSFFERLAEEQHQASLAPDAAVAEIAEPPAAATIEERAEEQPLIDANVDTASPPTAAATALESVMHALSQLTQTAAGGDAAAAAAADNTALLQQMLASLGQATEAFAALGYDVGALTSLAGTGLPAAQAYSPELGAKLQRTHDSPDTPTRPIAAFTDTPAGVATPVLLPGPPVVRALAADVDSQGPLISAPSERFQLLEKRLSSASNEAHPQQAQQQSVVVSLNVSVAEAPAVDVGAVEARVRAEEAAAWECRLARVVDEERDAAALVIAGVEAERDGLQSRVTGLERELAGAAAEKAALEARLADAAVERRSLLDRLAAAEAVAGSGHLEAERSIMAAQLAAVAAERDELAAQLAVERAEKADLAAALTEAQARHEELRARYTSRFESLSSELEATRGSLAELQAEHDELLLCLGQESNKVVALVDALREAGGKPEPIIERIEAEYETMGIEGGEDEDAEPQESDAENGLSGAEGWEGADLELDVGAV